jgi:hypothetical protein
MVKPTPWCFLAARGLPPSGLFLSSLHPVDETRLKVFIRYRPQSSQESKSWSGG